MDIAIKQDTHRDFATEKRISLGDYQRTVDPLSHIHMVYSCIFEVLIATFVRSPFSEKVGQFLYQTRVHGFVDFR